MYYSAGSLLHGVFLLMSVNTLPASLQVDIITHGSQPRVFCLVSICHLSRPEINSNDTTIQRSTASRTCVVTRTFSTFGDRAFSAAGPGLWNSLPSHLKDAYLLYNEFRRSLKTFLFGQWGTVWTLLTAPTRDICTCLLTYFTMTSTAVLLVWSCNMALAWCIIQLTM